MDSLDFTNSLFKIVEKIIQNEDVKAFSPYFLALISIIAGYFSIQNLIKLYSIIVSYYRVTKTAKKLLKYFNDDPQNIGSKFKKLVDNPQETRFFEPEYLFNETSIADLTSCDFDSLIPRKSIKKINKKYKSINNFPQKTIIVGNAGIGKTTFLFSKAHDLIKNKCKKYIPIYIDLKNCTSKENPFDKIIGVLKKTVEEEYPDKINEHLQCLGKTIKRSKRIPLLLLDGLDECLSNINEIISGINDFLHENKEESQLRKYRAVLGNFKIIIACRISKALDLYQQSPTWRGIVDNASILSVQPFDTETVVNYLSKSLSLDKATVCHYLDNLKKRSLHLYSLIHHPFHLKLFKIKLHSISKEKDINWFTINEPKNEADLYAFGLWKGLFNKDISCINLQSKDIVPSDKLKEILFGIYSNIAFHMYDKEKSGCLKKTEYINLIRNELDKINNSGFLEENNLTEEILLNFNILTPINKTTYRFYHFSIQDFFLSWYYYKHYTQQDKDEICSNLENPTYKIKKKSKSFFDNFPNEKTVSLFLCLIDDDANPLLKTLAENNPALCVKAMTMLIPKNKLDIKTKSDIIDNILKNLVYEKHPAIRKIIIDRIICIGTDWSIETVLKAFSKYDYDLETTYTIARKMATVCVDSGLKYLQECAMDSENSAHWPAIYALMNIISINEDEKITKNENPVKIFKKFYLENVKKMLSTGEIWKCIFKLGEWADNNKNNIIKNILKIIPTAENMGNDSQKTFVKQKKAKGYYPPPINFLANDGMMRILDWTISKNGRIDFALMCLSYVRTKKCRDFLIEIVKADTSNIWNTYKINKYIEIDLRIFEPYGWCAIFSLARIRSKKNIKPIFDWFLKNPKKHGFYAIWSLRCISLSDSLKLIKESNCLLNEENEARHLIAGSLKDYYTTFIHFWERKKIKKLQKDLLNICIKNIYNNRNKISLPNYKSLAINTLESIFELKIRSLRNEVLRITEVDDTIVANYARTVFNQLLTNDELESIQDIVFNEKNNVFPIKSISERLDLK